MKSNPKSAVSVNFPQKIQFGWVQGFKADFRWILAFWVSLFLVDPFINFLEKTGQIDEKTRYSLVVYVESSGNTGTLSSPVSVMVPSSNSFYTAGEPRLGKKIGKAIGLCFFLVFGHHVLSWEAASTSFNSERHWKLQFLWVSVDSMY